MLEQLRAEFPSQNPGNGRFEGDPIGEPGRDSHAGQAAAPGENGPIPGSLPDNFSDTALEPMFPYAAAGARLTVNGL